MVSVVPSVAAFFSSGGLGRATVQKDYPDSLFFLEPSLADATIGQNDRSRAIETFLTDPAADPPHRGMTAFVLDKVRYIGDNVAGNRGAERGGGLFELKRLAHADVKVQVGARADRSVSANEDAIVQVECKAQSQAAGKLESAEIERLQPGSHVARPGEQSAA